MPMVSVSLGAAMATDPFMASNKTNNFKKLFIFRSERLI
jgi:hypothetical protein